MPIIAQMSHKWPTMTKTAKNGQLEPSEKVLRILLHFFFWPTLAPSRFRDFEMFRDFSKNSRFLQMSRSVKVQNLTLGYIEKHQCNAHDIQHSKPMRHSIGMNFKRVYNECLELQSGLATSERSWRRQTEATSVTVCDNELLLGNP